MPNNDEGYDPATESTALTALAARSDLGAFGDVSLGLFALELYFGIDDIETAAANSITDGPGDRKCDLIHIDRDSGGAVIAQVYTTSSPGPREAPANKASDLNTAVAWVFGQNVPSGLPAALESAIQELRTSLELGEVESVDLWYVHNLVASDNVRSELDRAVESANALIVTGSIGEDIAVRALEVDATRLDSWYSRTKSPIQVVDDLKVPADAWFEVHGQEWEAVSTTVPASWLQELFATYGDELYSANIRGYMPSRQSARNINHNIETTAAQDGDNFWAYNNGVTALVHSIDCADELEISGLAVVNGAQTTGAIAKTGAALDGDAKVPIRFVACSNEDLVERIIRYNNSQNPIKASDFRSMDKHQERLRNEFASIPDATYLGARRGGRGDRARRPSNLVPSDTTAQSLACLRGEPGTAYHGLRTSWERDELYAKYFNDHTTARGIVFAYSLMKAVQARKSSLATRGESDLTDLETRQLEFLRKRGATYLATTAVALCLETFVHGPVADRMNLAFEEGTSPFEAEEYWRPVVGTALTFVSKLGPAAESGALRNRETVNSATDDFAAMVEATAESNAAIYEEFAAHVTSGLSS